MRKQIFVCGFIFFLIFCGSLATNNLYAISERLEILLSKAETLEKTNNFDAAIAIYNQALSIASDNKLGANISFIHKKIGDIYYAQKQFQSAKHHYHKSVLYDSSNTYSGDVHLNLGLLYRKENNTDSLLIHLKYALDI